MQHLCHAQSARQMKEKNQQVFIDTLTLVRRMIDFGLYINIYRGTYAEKCMNIVHGMYKKGLFLRALPLSLSASTFALLWLGLLCSRGRTMSRRDLYVYISLLLFSFHFLNLYHSFVCWFFISASFVDAVICLLARA